MSGFVDIKAIGTLKITLRCKRCGHAIVVQAEQDAPLPGVDEMERHLQEAHPEGRECEFRAVFKGGGE